MKTTIKTGTWVHTVAQSRIVLFNMVAGTVLAAIGALVGILSMVLPPLTMVVVPFWILFTLLGYPWLAGNPVDFSVADQSVWSKTNFVFELLLVRGVFINATILGVLFDVVRLVKNRPSSRLLEAPSNTIIRFVIRTLALLAIAMTVVLVILPWTEMTRAAVLQAAWREVQRQPLIPWKPPAREPSAFQPVVQMDLDNPALSAKGRRHTRQLAAALEGIFNVPGDDQVAASVAEKAVSAAFLCVSSHNVYTNAGGADDVIPDYVRDTVDTPERVAAFKRFLQLSGPTYTLPRGDGCQ